jgi:hypothetical protein
LQYQHGTNRFLRYHAISRCVGGADDPMTRGFVAALEESATQHEIGLVQFEKCRREDSVMAEQLRRFASEGGAVFIGKAGRTYLRNPFPRSP